MFTFILHVEGPPLLGWRREVLMKRKNGTVLIYTWDDNYVILLTTVTTAMLEVLLVVSV